jgi:hypothetical protein
MSESPEKTNHSEELTPKPARDFTKNQYVIVVHPLEKLVFPLIDIISVDHFDNIDHAERRTSHAINLNKNTEGR